ncbi:hypothetical protein Bca52824_070783 [Brassica carinata]|uniref:Neprosin PEP catalytic domain-containing protein n=1 Tax=Brassica carinata TaxID=52824 RepID=A0A8X7Q4K1_BRACI|nr:hypothetical protein Bca52824_070783 [Brassica carinata]
MRYCVQMHFKISEQILRKWANAIAYVEGDNYYGAKATINVWKPKIQQQHEFTFLQIWLLSDLFRKYLNSIEAGWKVNRIYMVTIIQGSSLTGL